MAETHLDTGTPDPTLHAIPLAAQVGGHAGVMTSEDGSLVIKPALPLELQFYQRLNSDPAFEGLQPFTPKFHDLHLHDETPLAPGAKDMFLENLSHTFLKPNILDIKLGTVLYDDNAPPDKVERMIKTARDTTSLETGVRLTGFQVYDNTTGQAVNTPKSYGKSIKPHQLTEGIAKFFPSKSSEGLEPELLLPILRHILQDVRKVRSAFEKLEVRMVGGSFLIIYEGDRERAKEGVGKLEGGDGDVGGVAPFLVKMIDFAHTKHVPGEGPDAGVLLGMDTVIRLLEGRIKEVEAGSTEI